MIFLILVGGDYGWMEEGLYVGRNNNTREHVKVMELGLLCFLLIFYFFPLTSPLKWLQFTWIWCRICNSNIISFPFFLLEMSTLFERNCSGMVGIIYMQLVKGNSCNEMDTQLWWYLWLEKILSKDWMVVTFQTPSFFHYQFHNNLDF